MAAAGGSVPTWQVLLIVRSGEWSTQSRIAKALGITEATLTHHLNALERQGLVRRWREDANRRVQRVALTDEGEAVFDRLREVAIRHDARLRGTLADDEVTRLAELLQKLEAGLAGSAEAGP
jgi:MarR family transcriptional regulator for hemolysin